MVNARSLREQAARLRGLADNCDYRLTATALLEIAEECDGRAARIDSLMRCRRGRVH